MSENTTELGEWVDRLLFEIFFQPDDVLSNNRMSRDLDKSLTVRINGKAIAGKDWVKSISEARGQNNLALVSCREVLASRGAGLAGGTVSHVSTFTLTDKKTGETKEESSLTLVTVVEKDGRRLMEELTEAYRAAE